MSSQFAPPVAPVSPVVPVSPASPVSPVPFATVRPATPLNTGKPQCGGGEEVGEYDLPLHVLGLCKCFVSEHSLSKSRILTIC